MSKTASSFIVIGGTVLLLYLGKSLLIPFVFAILIWLLMRQIRSLFDRVSIVKKYVPKFIKTLLSSAFVIGVLFVLGKLFQNNVQVLLESIDADTKQFQKVFTTLETQYNIQLQELIKEEDLNKNIGQIATQIVNSIGSFVQNLFVILIYVIFLILEESALRLKAQALFPKHSHFERSNQIFEQIESSVANYIGLKSLIAFTAATASFFILWGIGIKAPFLWALIIFVMNFIPTIGALVGTLFPTAFAFFQFVDLTPVLITLFSVGTVQLIVGNFLEPKLLGNSLNISPLVTIIALAVWGTLWGVTGMFLSVPITVIMVIIFSHFPNLRNVAIILSEKGSLNR